MQEGGKNWDEVQRAKPFSKEFYLSNPRSAEIREASIKIIRLVNEFLDQPRNQQDEDWRAEIMAKLELAHGELISLGIVPTDTADTNELGQDPVKAAEFIAGQLIQIFNYDLISPSQEAHDRLTEFGGQADRVAVGNASDLTQPQRDSVMVQAMCGGAVGQFDVSQEELSEDLSA